ncbi:Impact family [Ascosphaera apis ARSEF 7405]|uniref:Impact family n=1 Tax=Ascosphaera apis ARSEF 7405 TaxID=392613 RepID=A0A166NME9_9EURO|nr:Impact family [Ascosphaera apis ARSEF 7405]
MRGGTQKGGIILRVFPSWDITLLPPPSLCTASSSLLLIHSIVFWESKENRPGSRLGNLLPLTRKKSIFIARAAHVTSEETARAYLRDLIASDKKVAKATHNITAWRIKGAPHHQQQHQHVQGLKSTQGSTTSTTTTTTTTTTGNDIQNSDDDGESAAGGKLLTLLQMMDAWNVMVVVTRWFGGVKLGPERFRVINAVAKEALDKGGWNKSGQSNESNSKMKDTKKKKKRS